MKKPNCPRCNSSDVKEVKAWELRGGKGGKDFFVHAYRCNNCAKSFRKLERI